MKIVYVDNSTFGRIATTYISYG